MVFKHLIGCLTSKYEAVFLLVVIFFKMTTNESRFNVLYFCQN